MPGYAFLQLIAVAAVIAIIAQCSVYPIRRWWGMAAAARTLRGSLLAFAVLVLGALGWGGVSGELGEMLERSGIGPLGDAGAFIGLVIFITYFMGSRYLADELERARAREDGKTAEGGE